MNNEVLNNSKTGSLKLNKFANDNPDIVFETKIPCYDNKFFGDSSHLNEKGAKVYTEEFIGKYIKQTR